MKRILQQLLAVNYIFRIPQAKYERKDRKGKKTMANVVVMVMTALMAVGAWVRLA